MPTPHKRAAVVYPNHDAAVMANPNHCAERESTMRRRHRPAIKAFTVCGPRSAKAVRTTVDACDFGLADAPETKQSDSGNRR
jgi:hypothetical protein